MHQNTLILQPLYSIFELKLKELRATTHFISEIAVELDLELHIAVCISCSQRWLLDTSCEWLPNPPSVKRPSQVLI